MTSAKPIIFTICAANYLPQALVLIKSIQKHCENWTITLGLVDQLSPRVRSAVPEDVIILPVEDLDIPHFKTMTESYSLVELCTAVKPSYFQYLFREFPDADQVHYIDPDIRVYHSLDELQTALSTMSVLLTPHHFTPIPLDGQFPQENLALNHGVYNLGYLGLRRTPVADALLIWWAARMAENCRIDLLNGWFVDQLYFNYAPIYFKDVCIFRHPGANVAFWNLHERRIKIDLSIEYAEQSWPLLFFHFSGFSPLQSGSPTRVQVRIDWESSPGTSRLLAEYADGLMEEGYHEWREIAPAFLKTIVKEDPRKAQFKALKQFLKRIMGPILRRLGLI
jgi:hypothetical protein